MNLIEATDLRKTYRLSRRTSIDALRGVDVTIEAGEMVAIMGPSGSGKSTLMHLLGLLHSPDTDGGPRPTLRIDGVDATTLSDGDRTRIRARSMGFVFQSFNLVPTLTADENVALAAEYAGKSRPRRTGSGSRGTGARSAWPTGRATGRWSCPVASSSASQSRERWSTTRASSSATSRPATSTRRGRWRSWACCAASTASGARRSLLVTHDPEVGASCDRIIRMRDGRVMADERMAVVRALAA